MFKHKNLSTKETKNKTIVKSSDNSSTQITIFMGCDSIIGPMVAESLKIFGKKVVSVHQQAKVEGVDPFSLDDCMKEAILLTMIHDFRNRDEDVFILTCQEYHELQSAVVMYIEQSTNARIYDMGTLRKLKGWSAKKRGGQNASKK